MRPWGVVLFAFFPLLALERESVCSLCGASYPFSQVFCYQCYHYLGRVKKEVLLLPERQEVEYFYKGGRLQRKRLNHLSITYTRDAKGRVVEELWQGKYYRQRIQYFYLPSGKLWRKLHKGKMTFWTYYFYDQKGRISRKVSVGEQLVDLWEFYYQRDLLIEVRERLSLAGVDGVRKWTKEVWLRYQYQKGKLVSGKGEVTLWEGEQKRVYPLEVQVKWRKNKLEQIVFLDKGQKVRALWFD